MPQGRFQKGGGPRGQLLPLIFIFIVLTFNIFRLLLLFLFASPLREGGGLRSPLKNLYIRRSGVVRQTFSTLHEIYEYVNQGY